jgi:hypothetical protein
MINKSLLPSRGRYYAGDLYARKLNAIEMKELSKVRKENANKIFNKIIGNAIDGEETANIKVNDKLWLIYYLRSITYDDIPMKVVGKCKKCGAEKNYEYRLADLKVIYLDEDLPEAIALPNGDKLTLEFPNIETEIEVEKTKSNPAFIENIDSDVMTVASNVKSINGENVSIYEAYSYFTRGRGSAKDFSRLVSILRKHTFGAIPYAEYECDCGEKAYAEISMSPEFFLPEI